MGNTCEYCHQRLEHDLSAQPQTSAKIGTNDNGVRQLLSSNVQVYEP